MVATLIILGTLFTAGYVWIFWELKNAARLDEDDHIVIATLKNMRNIPTRLKGKLQEGNDFIVHLKKTKS